MLLVGTILNSSTIKLYRSSSWFYRRVTPIAEECFRGRTRIGTPIYLDFHYSFNFSIATTSA